MNLPILLNKKSITSSPKLILSPLSLLLLAACGGGGGTGSVIGSSSFSANLRDGFGMKGPLQNAKAFLDYNNNGFHTAGEPVTYTDENGYFEFELSDHEKYDTANVVITAIEGTVDGSGDAILSGIKLSAPASAKVVSVATSLMVEGDMTVDEVAQVLGLEEIEDIQSFNPYADGQNAELAKKFEAVSHEVATIVKTLSSVGEEAGLSAEEASAVSIAGLANAIKDKVDAADDSTTATIKLSDTTDVTDLQTIVDKVKEAAQDHATENNIVLDTNVLDQAKNADSLKKVSEFNAKVKEELAKESASLDGADIKALLSTSDQVVKTVRTVTKNLSQDENFDAKSALDSFDLDTAAKNLAPQEIALSGTTNHLISIEEHTKTLRIGEITSKDLGIDGQPSNDTITYSLDTESQKYFQIVEESGKFYLEFKTSPDYEKVAEYTVSIIATDQDGKASTQKVEINVTDVGPALTLSLSKDATTFIEGGLDAERDIQIVSDKISGFYDGINGANAVLSKLDNETVTDQNAITVSNQGVFITTDGGYTLSLEFNNFSPSSLKQLQTMFEGANDINDINLSGGFKKIQITDQDGSTLLQLSHNSSGITWKNPNADAGMVDTFLLKGSFENQIKDYIDFIKNIDAVANNLPSQSTYMNLIEELTALIQLEGISASSDGKTVFDFTVDYGELSLVISGTGGDHRVDLSVNADEFQNLDNQLIDLAGGEDQLFDMILTGQLSDAVLNFYDRTSNFDNIELELGYDFAGKELIDISVTDLSKIEGLETDPFILKNLLVEDTSSNGVQITTLSNPTDEIEVNLVGFDTDEVTQAINTVAAYDPNDFGLLLDELFMPDIRLENVIPQISENTADLKVADIVLNESTQAENTQIKLSGDDAELFEINENNEVLLINSPDYESKKDYSVNVELVEAGKVTKTLPISLDVTDKDVNIVILDEFGADTADRSNVQIIDFSAEYDEGWRDYYLDNLDQLSNLALGDTESLKGFSSYKFDDPISGQRSNLDTLFTDLTWVSEIIFGESLDTQDDDEQFDYVYEYINSEGDLEYYFVNDLDGDDEVPWISQAEESGLYVSYFTTFEDLDGEIPYFAIKSDGTLDHRNADTDIELDYKIFDWQSGVDIIAGTEKLSVIAKADLEAWATSGNKQSLLHGDVVIGDLLLNIPSGFINDVNIFAVDILNDKQDVFGVAFPSGDTDYVTSAGGFSHLSTIANELGFALSDIDFLNASFGGGGRGETLKYLSEQTGVLSFASLPNDDYFAQRFWDDFLEDDIMISSDFVIDVAGSENDGVFPEARFFADVEKTALSEYNANWSGTSFATPEALGDTIHALLQLDLAAYDEIYEDDAISIDEALSLLGIPSSEAESGTVLAAADVAIRSENSSASTEKIDLFSISIHEPDDLGSVVSDIV